MPERMIGPALVLVVLVVLVGYLLGLGSLDRGHVTAPTYRPSPSPQVSATTDPDGDRP
jgi:hypothetical protein